MRNQVSSEPEKGSEHLKTLEMRLKAKLYISAVILEVSHLKQREWHFHAL
jgi:hypothetical protein